MKYLDLTGLQRFWNKIKTHVQTSLQGYATETYVDEKVSSMSGSGGKTPSEGLAFSLMSDGNSYGVSGIGTCADTDIIIPSVHNGKRVSGIKLQAFYNNTNITSVVIPNSVTYINKHAFNGCTSLASVVIPESVTTIGYYAFQNCTNLKIYCETSSKPSGWDAQWNASDRPVFWGAVTDILGLNGKIAECVTETELDAKGYATESYVDEKLSNIPSGGGSGDSSIIDLGAQENHKDAQQAMVDHLMQMNADDGCYLFKYWCGCSENACFAVVLQVAEHGYVEGTVYDSIHRYRHFCYEYSQGEFTTDGCWLNIASFDESFDFLPTEDKNVIGAISELYYIAIDGYKSKGDFAYLHTSDNTCTIGRVPDNTSTEVLIPSEISGLSVTAIGEKAFQSCSSLTSVTIPNSVTSIGEYAFMFCSNLSDLKLSNNLISIGKQAFYQCDSLTEIVIPNSVTSIDANAFAQCDNLKTVIIPASVTTINNRAFHNCPNLTIYCEAPSKPTGWTVLWNESNCPVVWGFANNFVDVNKKLAEIGTGGSGNSGGAGLSMPRIRLANMGMVSDEIIWDKPGYVWYGKYFFSIEVQDGTVQEGDQLEICSLKNHNNSRGRKVKKPRQFTRHFITTEEIEMLSYNPYLQIYIEELSLRELHRTNSMGEKHPKYIRIRRPIYDEEGEEINAIFSNVIPVHVKIPVTIIDE